MLHLQPSFAGCWNLGHFGKETRNTLKVLICGVRDGRRKSIRSILWKNEGLHRVEEEKNIVHTILRRKANWIGHILRRNCLLKDVTEGKIAGTRIRGRRHKQLLDDLREKRKYWNLKEEALNCTLWKTRFGRGYIRCRKRDCEMNYYTHLCFWVRRYMKYALLQ